MFTTISLNDTHINFWWHGDIHIDKHNLVSFLYLIVFKRHKSKTQGCYFTRRYIIMMDETVEQHNNNTFSLMEHKEEEKTAVTLPHIAN